MKRRTLFFTLPALAALGFFACSSSPSLQQAQITHPLPGQGGSSGSSSGATSSGSSSGSTGSSSGSNGSSSGSPTDGGNVVLAEAGAPKPDPCIAAGTCPPGTWVNVTPTSIDLTDGLDCGNYGSKTVVVDPLHPGDVYTLFMCQGVWKSSDYGMTWTGPINKGTNGTTVNDCAGGITIPRSFPAGTTTPTIYMSCIRGTPTGFWVSTNAGVDWTQQYVLATSSTATPVNQSFYPPVVDPYDSQHLLMAGHAVDVLAESTNGGQTWTQVPQVSAMDNPGGTGGPNFIDTGSAATSRTTWLWVSSGSSTGVGSWRTTNSGTAWTRVTGWEHMNGANGYGILYQPDNTSGVMYIAGSDGQANISGVNRSSDYGLTWTPVGTNEPEAIVFGTPKNVYAMFGWAPGPGQVVAPNLEVAAPPATGTWTAPTTPTAMSQGPAEAAVMNDGTHNIIVVANYNAGVWRYVEP